MRRSHAVALQSSKGFFVGGQAAIEGIVIRGRERIALAVRGRDGLIKVKSWSVKPYSSISPLFGFPVIRGVVALYDALVWGMKALFYSANEVLDDEEKISFKEIVGGISAALGLAIGLFVLFPTFLAHSIEAKLELGRISINLIEGGLRVLTFMAYLIFISFSKDIRRVFSYHGAEHKTINAYESLGLDIAPEVVKDFSRFHHRCGTSFILLVLLISIACFALFEQKTLLSKILVRVSLIPLVAGISYEVLRLSFSSKLIRFLAKPGIWLQYLTTREPNLEQIEVGIIALKEALRDVGEAKEV